jgi:hypothetical protein
VFKCLKAAINFTEKWYNVHWELLLIFDFDYQTAEEINQAMKTAILSILFGSLLVFSASGAFLPEGNGDFTPGYEEGTDNPEKKAGLVFMDWHGLNPDDSGNLGTLTFGGPLAVDAAGKLTLTWGRLKNL